MSNVAVLRSEPRESQQVREYLGPAVVTRGGPQEVEARLPSGAMVTARLALAFLYEVQPEDVVLVIGNADGHYVIGVLSGTGKATMEFPGDVALRAGGVLHLSGEKGVRVEAPEVDMRAGKLRVLAEAVSHTFTSLRQHVTELLSTRAGKAHTVVDGASVSQSKSATILTEEKVTINGKAIHLG